MRYLHHCWTFFFIFFFDMDCPFPGYIYLFNDSNRRNNSKSFEICSKLTKNIPVRFDVFIVNFEHITSFSSDFIVYFEPVNVFWVGAETSNESIQLATLSYCITFSIEIYQTEHTISINFGKHVWIYFLQRAFLVLF